MWQLGTAVLDLAFSCAASEVQERPAIQGTVFQAMVSRFNGTWVVIARNQAAINDVQ